MVDRFNLNFNFFLKYIKPSGNTLIHQGYRTYPSNPISIGEYIKEHIDSTQKSAETLFITFLLSSQVIVLVWSS